MISRIAVAALAALALPMTTGTAQERPTAEDVMLRLASDDSAVRRKASQHATDLLRQERGPMTAEERAVLIEALAEAVLAADIGIQAAYNDASGALVYAVQRPGTYVDEWGYIGADENPGEPVPEAFDALVRIYETRVARALASGGDDPFLEAAFRDHARRTSTGEETTFEEWQLYFALGDLFRADLGPDGRGWAYVLALFKRSKPPCKDGPDEPPDCTVGPGSTWCAAGRLLHMTTLAGRG